MREKFEANYETLDTVATDFSNCCETMQEMVNRLSQQTDTLRSEGWIGRGAEAFFAELDNDVMPRLQRLIDAFQQACDSTNKINTTLQSAEDDACACFRS